MHRATGESCLRGGVRRPGGVVDRVLWPHEVTVEATLPGDVDDDDDVWWW